jgi:PncC family amidohydrolase
VDEIQRLSAAINEQLRDSGKPTVATAESLTGGGVARAITSFSGSSAYFVGGIIAYVNDAKHALLGVSQRILNERGAVSPECAAAMAEGARRAFRSDLGVSTTGIAGPTGATERKPVGLVYIAVANNEGAMVEEHQFDGDREAVTRASIEAALRLLIHKLEDNSDRSDQTDGAILD